jgi:D-sedoheptulose 7-phosphate isomerase
MKRKNPLTPSAYQETYFRLIREAAFTVRGRTASVDRWMADLLALLRRTRSSGGRLFFIGNGASCSIASHFATDFTKNGRINSFSLNEGTQLTCFSNDYSFETAYQEMLRCYMKKGDLLFAISSSGRSPNIVNAVRFALRIPGTSVVSFSGFNPDNPIRKAAPFSCFIDDKRYGFVESSHVYFLHHLIDLFLDAEGDA